MSKLKSFLLNLYNGFVVGIIGGLLVSAAVVALLEKDQVVVMPSYEVFEVTWAQVEVAQKLPPPYQSCATEYRWCRIMAEALVYEARGEGSIGMRAVAHVILERVKADGWPNGIAEVLKQQKQFSYLQDKHLQTKPTQEDFDKAYKEAYDAYFGISENPVPGAKWYHSASIKAPRWTKKLEVVKVIGNHIFYKEKS